MLAARNVDVGRGFPLPRSCYVSVLYSKMTWIKAQHWTFIYYMYLFSFVDLNDCFATTGIYSLKNDPMKGICEHRRTINRKFAECKFSCLQDSRCFCIEHYSFCIQYWYRATESQCYFSRSATYVMHKGNYKM